MNRYLGPDFPQILSKDNVEYKQANLTVPGSLTSFPFYFILFDKSDVATSNRLIRL